VGSPRRRYVNSLNLIAWVLIALVPTLLIFQFFPTSDASGEVVGITVTGAIAGFLTTFLIGSRAGTKALEKDQNVEDLRAEIGRLRSALHTAPVAVSDTKAIPELRELVYRVKGRKRRRVVILTGDLMGVRGIDVWVNPENLNMEMARFHERSVSGAIRYWGSRRDDAGDPVEDLIANQVRVWMQQRGKLAVNPGTILPTGPGELGSSHGVKRLYHAAAVHGRVNAGYRPIEHIGECVTNALARLDSDEEAQYQCRTIVFPLLGTGSALGAHEDVVADLVGSAAEYVSQDKPTGVDTVYFLARSVRDLELCRRACNSCRALESAGGSAEELLRTAAVG
jgi:O-acetyl-ADP-ribose deacetylase (regulator of RNase III)